jgi:hypothetical protein
MSAAGVAAGLAVTAVLAAWWVLPITVAVVLTASVAREARR